MKSFYTTLAVTAATATIAEANISQTFKNFGLHAARFNEGMMRSMNDDPDADYSDCITQAQKAGSEIEQLFNVGKYFDGKFNFGDFLNQGQVTSIQVISEFEKCGYNEFLIQFDGVMSHIPEVSAMGANLIVQLLTGFKDDDTAVFKSWEYVSGENWEEKNWMKIGLGVQLFMSQLVKFEAPDVKLNVVTI